MALTQDELDQVYNYVMGKGQSLAGLPDGGSDLSSMYLAPLLKYSPGGAATLVRLAVSVLKGDSAYQVWVNEPGNAGKTLSDFFLSIKGAKGDPFTFADFTPEQLADLALTYDKLTPEQKEEMKLHFGDLTEADILVLQKPATDAADEVREQMVQISQEVNQAITDTNAAKDAANTAAVNAKSVSDHPGYIGNDYHVYTWDYVTGAYNKTDTVLRPEGFSIYRTYATIAAMNADLSNVPEGKFVLINTGSVDDEDTAKLYVKGAANFEYLVDMSGAIGFTGKTPQITIGTVTVGSSASASLLPDGTDDNGNPKFKLNLVIVAGPQGLTPIIEMGTTTTGQPGTDAVATLAPNGQTSDGRDKYLLNLTIPQGLPGTGSGNVLVPGPGLVSGKKYLFVPSGNDSTVGTFVEYTPPGNATAESAGLMTSDQFQKLEKLNPSSLSNDVTGKKVEYTDAGKLLFEDKETFAVDADNELTLAGKKLSELGGGAQYLDLSPLIDAEGNPVVTVTDEFLSKLEEAYNKKYTNASASWADNAVMPMSIQYYGDENIYSIIIGIITNNAGEFLIFSYTLTISTTNKSLNFTPLGIQLSLSGDGTKALMNDGTYKEVGGDYQLPGATDSALGGIKTGYAASGNNYPVQLDGSDKAYVNVPWTDTDTTYSPATETTNGLMSSDDKTKLDRIGSYTTATTVANLNANYENIEVSLNANASLSVNAAGRNYDGLEMNVLVYCPSTQTITIPTSGNYESMCGSSHTCPAGRRVEFNLKCYVGIWHIAKLEQQ